MRMQYSTLKSKPRTLRSLTGLNRDEFEALLISFGAAWDSFVKATFFERADRKRAVGAGRIAHLKQLEDKLLFILFYYRQYPTQKPPSWNKSIAGERMDTSVERTAQSGAGLRDAITRAASGKPRSCSIGLS